MKITVALAAVALTAFSTLAQAIGPAPAPLAQRETRLETGQPAYTAPAATPESDPP